MIKEFFIAFWESYKYVFNGLPILGKLISILLILGTFGLMITSAPLSVLVLVAISTFMWHSWNYYLYKCIDLKERLSKYE